ncbi:hypothetical protein L917_19728 [Phytophthora nicotianae]|uniref:Uncharacterized protein n=2 Tax=Phytophthora nicotianae TaxID=4792 RepID=W2K3H8_PHYNI|nr:hypothetical protein L917_19728 [Phytophthora nicotianae]
MLVGLYRDVATKTLQMQVFMYEPLIDEENREQMIAVWEGIMKHKGKNDVEESEGKGGLIGFIITSPVKWIETPQQPDAVSYGIAQAYNYLSESMRLQEHRVSKRDVSAMRLRMIWMVVYHFKDRSISMYHADKTHQIQELLQKKLG